MVDACLNPKEHRLIVFHDDSHQRDGVEPCYPPYIPDGTQDTPEGWAKKSQVTIKNRQSLFLTHVVRLPGAARDPAMSFSRRDVDLKTVEGRVDFYPLLDERVEGEIKYEEVLVRTQRDDKAKCTDKASKCSNDARSACAAAAVKHTTRAHNLRTPKHGSRNRNGRRRGRHTTCYYTGR